MATPSKHTWKFFRTGGLDQVALETGADLLELENLDQKLWVALSCPVKGLEIDEATLKLIDTDGDGRIRVPELIAAIKWAAPRLTDAGVLLTGADGLALEVINGATPEGKATLASARQILANLGKKSATVITTADSGNTAQIFAASPLTGDGVIPPEAAADEPTKALINEIVACLGGAADRTGRVGVTAAKVETFFAEAAAYAEWAGKGAGLQVVGEGTAAAAAAIAAVRAKIDDFFARGRLAAFDGRALAALNRPEADYLAFVAKDLKPTAEEVSGFPLATIAPGKALPLADGVNPAWAAALATLREAAVTPVFGAGRSSLTEADWGALGAKFSAYDSWLAAKAGAAVEKLGLPRVKEILAGNGREALARLIAEDHALEPEFKAIADVDRLVRFHRDLRALLHNFVNFADFYSRDRWAAFQAGTLYLDSRSTELCIKVDGPNPLAATSRAYIAYCSCTRPGGAAMTIAACFTQGDSDYLYAGRHGVFYDRQGQDWDAVITSLVDNPISVRQAFWSPYKKFLRMIEEQVAKRASAADAAATAKLEGAASNATDTADGKVPNKPKFDVGTIAALGVGLGAIGTLLGGLVAGFLGLKYYMPLGVLGIMLAISGPSMAIAWLKLRQRTLGPILEGNGWAVNGRVKINVPLGTALTDLAVLPPGAQRSLEDPYEDKEAARRRRQTITLLVLLVLLVAAFWIRHEATKHPGADGKARYFWEDRPAVAAPAAVAPAAPAPPAK